MKSREINPSAYKLLRAGNIFLKKCWLYATILSPFTSVKQKSRHCVKPLRYVAFKKAILSNMAKRKAISKSMENTLLR